MKATDTFRTRPYLHNCAQAVAFKYKDLFSADEQQVLDRFATCGSGHAPGGVCGALHVALLARPDKADEILSLFKERTNGKTLCLDIKTISKTPCPDCVQAADDILASLSGENK